MKWIDEFRRHLALGRPRACVEAALEWAWSDPDDAPSAALALLDALEQLHVIDAFGDELAEQHEHLMRVLEPDDMLRIGAWWGKTEGRVGLAPFPIAMGALGSVRFACVEAGAKPCGDESFRSAVEQARAHAETVFGTKLDHLGIRVKPELSGDAALIGGSVGLAAFVAFASHELRLPVPCDAVFSGECAESNGRAVFSAVPQSGLQPKREGVAQFPLLKREFFPGHTPGVSTDPLEILQAVFGRLNIAPDSSHTTSPALSEVELRIEALLAAALEPLHEDLLWAALETWSDGLLAGMRRDVVLDGMGTRIVRDVPWVKQAAPLASERTSKAHAALAKVLPDGLHRAFHLFCETHDSTDFARHANESTIRRCAEMVMQLAPPHRPILKTEQSSLNALCCRLAVELTERTPIEGALTQLSHCETELDRLLWLQCMLERLLSHVVARAPRQTDNPKQSKKLEQLVARPSVGLLEEWAQLHEVWPRDLDLSGPLNDALHHTGAWHSLNRHGGADHLAETSQTIAVGMLQALESDALSAVLEQPASWFVIDEWYYRGVVRSYGDDADPQPRYWRFDSLDIGRGAGVDDEVSVPDVWLPPALLYVIEPRPNELPMPLAHASIVLRRALSSENPVSIVDAADILLASLLRLVWLPCAVVSLPDELREPDRRWLGRVTKRNLFERICQADPGGLAGDLAEWIRSEAETIWDVIELLERLEHAPPPFAEAETLAKSAGVCLVGLLQTLASKPWRLVGTTLAGEPVDLYGCRPVTASGSLPRGEVAWLRGDEHASFGPFAVCASSGNRGRLYLLHETKAPSSKKRRKKLSQHKPKLYTTSVRGVLEFAEAEWEGEASKPTLTSASIKRLSR